MSVINLKSGSRRPARLRALVLVGCVLGIGSSMAHATPATEGVPSVAVKYSALDLATDDGAGRLFTRIATAAQAVCPDASPRNLSAYAHSKMCQSEVIARAVHDVRSARLAAVYSAHASRG
jgi:UrcA family protein